MLIDYIVLKNIGPFYGEQTIKTNLCKEKAKQKTNLRNTTVIHAQNYVGKTSILRSIIWCLYDDILPDDHGQEVILMNRTAEEEGLNEYEVKIYLFDEKKGIDYLIQRKKDIRYPSSECLLFKIESGNSVPQDKDKFPELIEKHLPKDLSKFFFLKGEFTSYMASRKKDISKSVKNLLGINLIQTAIEDLVNILKLEIEANKRNKINFNRSSKLSDEITELEIETERITNLIDEKESEVNEINNQATNLLVEVEQIERNKRLKADYDIALKRKEKKIIKKSILEKEKKELLYKDFFSVFSTKIIDKADTVIIQNYPIKDRHSHVTTKLLTQLLEEKMCICGRSLLENSNEYNEIKDLLNYVNDGDVTEDILKIQRAIGEYKKGGEDLKNKYITRLKEQNELNDTIETSEKEIKRLLNEIDKEKSYTHNYKEEYERLNKKKDRYIKEIYSHRQDLSDLQINLAKKRKEKTSIPADENTVSEHEKRTALIKKIKIHLINEKKQTEKTAINKIRTKMQEIIDSSLTQHHNVIINDDFTYSIDNEYLSGGHKRILDFAFIASILSYNQEDNTLLQTSNIMLPLVVDSAFGEIDEEYRKSLAKFLPGLVPQIIFLLSGTQANKLVNYIPTIENKYMIVHYNKDNQNNENMGKLLIDDKEYQTKFFSSDKNYSKIVRL